MTGDGQSAEVDRPSTCQNPEADCYRDPDKLVHWAEDYTSDEPRVEIWVCDPCWAMFCRGTRVSPNEKEVLEYAE